ncbi:MAG: alpha/beta fold hydrolase [Nibricoccus sp.]
MNRRVGPFCLAGLVLFSLTGCVSGMLSRRVVEAPNKSYLPSMVRDEKKRAKYDATWSQVWLQPVGPPAAELAVAVVEPRNYGMVHKIDLRTRKDGKKYLAMDLQWEVPSAGAPLAEPKGTILILHGYRDSKECMMHWALCLAEQGYRCVLVDLRGHGRSTGEWIGFGAFETSDLQRVLDGLEQRKLLAGRLGVLGLSYGGSVGLRLTAQDSRVATVVALEPFSDPRKAVEEFSRVFAGKYVKNWTADDYGRVLGKSAKKAGFDWADADVLGAMDRLKVPSFIVHGEKDTWISPEHSRALVARAKVPCRLKMMPNDDHYVLSIRLSDLAPDVINWFGEHLK